MKKKTDVTVDLFKDPEYDYLEPDLMEIMPDIVREYLGDMVCRDLTPDTSDPGNTSLFIMILDQAWYPDDDPDWDDDIPAQACKEMQDAIDSYQTESENWVSAGNHQLIIVIHYFS